jgi:hypothetical protein
MEIDFVVASWMNGHPRRSCWSQLLRAMMAGFEGTSMP